MTDKSSAESRARRVGRVIGIAVFAAIVVAFTAICSIEIILQAWGHGASGTTGTGGDQAPAKPEPADPLRR